MKILKQIELKKEMSILNYSFTNAVDTYWKIFHSGNLFLLGRKYLYQPFYFYI